MRGGLWLADSNAAAGMRRINPLAAPLETDQVPLCEKTKTPQVVIHLSSCSIAKDRTKAAKRRFIDKTGRVIIPLQFAKGPNSSEGISYVSTGRQKIIELILSRRIVPLAKRLPFSQCSSRIFVGTD
jgi:hypothetical protein